MLQVVVDLKLAVNQETIHLTTVRRQRDDWHGRGERAVQAPETSTRECVECDRATCGGRGSVTTTAANQFHCGHATTAADAAVMSTAQSHADALSHLDHLRLLLSHFCQTNAQLVHLSQYGFTFNALQVR